MREISTAMDYARRASKYFIKNLEKSDKKGVVNELQLHNIPVTALGVGINQGVVWSSISGERVFKEVDIKYIIVPEKDYWYVKSLLEDLGINVPILGRDFNNTSEITQEELTNLANEAKGQKPEELNSNTNILNIDNLEFVQKDDDKGKNFTINKASNHISFSDASSQKKQQTINKYGQKKENNNCCTIF